MDDREIRWIRNVQRFQDRRSAEQLIESYYDEMFRYFYKQTMDRELSLDLTQELMIRLLKSLCRFDPDRASFRTFIYRLASRQMIDYYRSKMYQQARRTEPLEDVDSLTRIPFSDERLAEIMEQVATYSEEEQCLLQLKWFGGYTFQEIAEKEQKPLSTIKTSYYRLIERLRKELEHE